MKKNYDFYEAPHKLIYTLNDMRKVFGNRNIALVRELTKIHEQVLRFTLMKQLLIMQINHRRVNMLLLSRAKSKTKQKK